jgi:hypothetical protein
MSFEDQRQSQKIIRQVRRKDRRDKLPAGHEFSQADASWTSDMLIYKLQASDLAY